MLGPMTPGMTHAVESVANIRGRRRSGQGPPDRDVGDRRDRARAEALDRPGGDEHAHRWREAADQEAQREQPDPVRNGRVSPPRSIMIPATTIPSRLPRKNAEKTQP